MSDLNQIVQRVRSGCDPEFYQKMIIFLIREYKNGSGPICCFYTCPSKEIPEAMILEGFKNHAQLGENWVIGCSRGCLLLDEVRRDKKLYSEKLCKECVEDAEELLKETGV